jgi:predicted kinase
MWSMPSPNLTEPIERVLRSLPLADPAETTPVLFVISGLPGTGKSFLARQIAARLPCVIVETDFIRKTLAPQPAYTKDESARVHRVAQQVIEWLLRSNRHAIYDATNLAEWHREKAYRLAEKTRARLLVIRTTAPDDVVRARLAKRLVERDPHDWSDADWQVHQLLKAELEPVRRAHLVVDTSRDIEPAIRRILRAAR